MFAASSSSYLAAIDRFQGQVTEIDDKGLCGINYDSGAQEWLQLEQQNFRLLGPRAPSAGLTPLMQVHHLLF